MSCSPFYQDILGGIQMQRGGEGHKIVCDFIGFHKHAENGEDIREKAGQNNLHAFIRF